MAEASAPYDRSTARHATGSRARCLELTHGPADLVAARLTALSGDGAAVIPGRHVWMPCGPEHPVEAELSKPSPFLTENDRNAVANWWLAARPETARTPNWDIVSQAEVDGRPGLLLVEAKAHPEELDREAGGKSIAAGASLKSRENHARIGSCIAEANAKFALATGMRWGLSVDTRYQMSNRFAWAYKLADRGLAVVLVYLGFLDATEMRSRYSDASAWESHVLRHAEGVVPAEAWGRVLSLGEAAVTPMIRVMRVPLPSPG